MMDLSRHLNSLANRVWGMAPGAGTSLRGRSVRLVAHRGAHGPGLALENSLEAFALCRDLGTWGVELDVRLTLDDEPVIHHDPDCGRLFGRPDLRIDELQFADLRRAVPAIPRLDEVLERFGGQLHLMLELKEDWRQRPQFPAAVCSRLGGLEPGRDYHLLALEPDQLEGFRDIPRSAFVDIAWLNPGEIIRRNLELGHGAVAGSFALLSERRLQHLRDAGRQVGTGFVELPGALRREVYRGVDWIFTDRIVPLQTLLGEA